MYLALFFAPLLIFVNGYYLGKLFKRFKPNLNIFYTTLFGSISYFGTFVILLIPLFLFSINYQFLFVYFLVYQGILLLIYAFNWRWFFITYKVDYKKLIWFSIVLCFFFVGWILSRNWTNYHDLLYGLTQQQISDINICGIKLSQQNVFISGENYFAYNFVVNYIRGFVYAFNVSDGGQIEIFVNTFIIITLSVFFALAFCAFFYNRNDNWKKLLLLSAFVLGLGIICFSFIKYAFLIFFVLCLIMFHFKSKEFNYENLSIAVINLTVLSGAFFEAEFIVVGILINFVMISISYLNKIPKASDYNILCLFSSVLLGAISFNSNYYVGFILLLIFILFYTFFFLFKSSSIYLRIMVKIDNWFYKNIKTIILFISFVVLILAIIMFFLDNDIDIQNVWVINDDKLNNYVTAPNMMLKLYALYGFINAVFWIANVAILGYATLRNNFIKKISIYTNFYSDFIILLVLLFWNPFFTSLLSRTNDFNILWVNMEMFGLFWAMFAAVFIRMVESSLSAKKIRLNNLFSVGIISALASSLIVFNNMV